MHETTNVCSHMLTSVLEADINHYNYITYIIPILTTYLQYVHIAFNAVCLVEFKCIYVMVPFCSIFLQFMINRSKFSLKLKVSITSTAAAVQ